MKSFEQLQEKLYAVGITVLPAHSNSSDLSWAISYWVQRKRFLLSSAKHANLRQLKSNQQQQSFTSSPQWQHLFCTRSKRCSGKPAQLVFEYGRNRDQAWRFPPGAPQPAETTAAKNVTPPRWTMSALHIDTSPHTTGVDWQLTWMFKTCM